MTLHISFASPQFIFHVSDRRFINIPDCTNYDAHGNKAIFLTCKDAQLLISYYGIGSIHKIGMDTWIADQFKDMDSRSLFSGEIAELLRERATAWFRQIQSMGIEGETLRHSFVMVGKPNVGFTFLTMVSNYDSVEESEEFPVAQPFFNTTQKICSESFYIGIAGGCHQSIPEEEKELLFRLVMLRSSWPRKRGPKILDLINVVVRLICRTADITPLVGRNCMSIFMDPDHETPQCRYHPWQSLPNFFNPIVVNHNFSFKRGDVWGKENKMTQREIVLDHINSIGYDPKFSPIPNPHALMYLSTGLHSLAKFVRNKEIKIIEKYKKRGINPPMVMVLSNHEIDPILHSMFNWYATDLVNFIRLIGLIDALQINKLKYKDVSQDATIRTKINEHCTNYIKKVHPDIYLWRNKVSAHFALTYPRKGDNLATLESSVMFPVSYERPYLEAGGLKWVLGEDESQLPNWKLTKVFEDLMARYWPERKIPELPAYQ
ncbi:hypothetical protein ACTRXD_18975 [Nitrospira sp. T9]|uniref:hypothetical protein n=1 Tax=unclassified Nitrospira TaxID=2652172 RepID=UPI003F983928